MEEIKLLDFEINNNDLLENCSDSPVDLTIDEKYNNGVSRVVTETGSYKVNLLKDIFAKGSNYNLEPDYQRRITWNKKKRSKLIESLIMNIPIPPIYLFETNYNQYEIMDGLQRVTAIIDFYKDDYSLSGLEEWPELNGKRYSKLDPIIREGIDRRQISVITLLKETALDTNQSEKIKRLVFERLNTGGVKLTGQEIRNAIFNGPGNDLCKKLSENPLFRELWEMPDVYEIADSDSDFEGEEVDEADFVYNLKQYKKLKSNTLYKRMGDVEMVLRFFSMRHINNFVGSLVEFLDNNLKILNTFNEEQLKVLENMFLETLKKAKNLFGTYAFKLFRDNEWTTPLRMIYDPMMLSLCSLEISENLSSTLSERIEELKLFYLKNEDTFFGKLQTKDFIAERFKLLSEFLKKYATN